VRTKEILYFPDFETRSIILAICTSVVIGSLITIATTWGHAFELKLFARNVTFQCLLSYAFKRTMKKAVGFTFRTLKWNLTRNTQFIHCQLYPISTPGSVSSFRFKHDYITRIITKAWIPCSVIDGIPWSSQATRSIHYEESIKLHNTQR
jgi:hypothetical protein